MSERNLADDLDHAKDCISRLERQENIVFRVVHVLELVGYGSVGLGEVLQDFASQSAKELRNLMETVKHADGNEPSAIEEAAKAQWIMKTTSNVLDMIPAAMQRNKAEWIGDKEKLSRIEIVQVVESFQNNPDIEALLKQQKASEVLETYVEGQEALDGELIAVKH